MKRADPAALQGAIGYIFRNPELLERALTHGSVLPAGDRAATYERLEFLGDRVLGLVIADLLDARFPDAPEGELSRRLNRLVNATTCAEVAEVMELQSYLRIGFSVRKAGRRATAGVLSDVCESLLGALYRDGGLEAARAVVERYWGPLLAGGSGPLRDAKTELQEWAHRHGFELPVYQQTLRSGPDHAPTFEIEVAVGTLVPARARGRSKREAEHDAAAELLRREGVWEAA